MQLRRLCALCALTLALAVSAAQSGAVAEDAPYDANAAPVYFMISFDDTFVVTHPKESQVIVVNVGTLVGGDDVVDTRFLVNTSLTGITLPDGRKDPTFEELQDNAATVLGSFYALDEQGFHSVVPEGGEVSVDIQQAVFEASNSGAIDLLLLDEPFPTTEDIAEVIAGYLPEGSTNTEAEIMDHVFGSGIQLSLTAGVVEGEGEMFPHEPNSESLFTFSFKFNEDAEFTQDVRAEISVDMQSPVNVESKTGVLPVTILGTDSFDTETIVLSTIEIGGVYQTQASFNGNGDLVVKFSVSALVAAGVLDANTTSLTLRCENQDGDLFFGVDTITTTSD